MKKEKEQELRKQAWAMSLDLLQRKVSALHTATVIGVGADTDRNLSYDERREVHQQREDLEEVTNVLNIVLMQRLHDEYFGETKYEEK